MTIPAVAWGPCISKLSVHSKLWWAGNTVARGLGPGSSVSSGQWVLAAHQGMLATHQTVPGFDFADLPSTQLVHHPCDPRNPWFTTDFL